MNNPKHLYPEHPAHQPDAAKMGFQVRPRHKNAIVELSAVEDTLAFAAFPVFHRKVFDAAWHTLDGIPCTQAVFEHDRNHPEIQKQVCT